MGGEGQCMSSADGWAVRLGGAGSGAVPAGTECRQARGGAPRLSCPIGMRRAPIDGRRERERPHALRVGVPTRRDDEHVVREDVSQP